MMGQSQNKAITWVVCGALVAGAVLVAALPARGVVADPLVMHGTVTDADGHNRLLILTDTHQDRQQFDVSDHAAISKSGQPIALQALQEGDRVIVQYTEIGGRRVARAITVDTQPPGVVDGHESRDGRPVTIDAYRAAR